MVLRFFLRYIANNQKLLEQLSESYPMRRLAQFVVAMLYRTKNIAERHNLSWKEMNAEDFRILMQTMFSNTRKSIEAAKNELKKKK